MNKRLTLLLAAGTLFAAGALLTAPMVSAKKCNSDGKDIIQTAIDAGKFETLATALQSADLIKTLQGNGPFTVFAPTDEAFSKLPKGTVESLLKPENRDQLVSILTYHVVPGKVEAKKAVKLSEAKAVSGQKLDLNVKGGSLYLNQSKVIAADIMATNGVIHVIDQVLLPPKT